MPKFPSFSIWRFVFFSLTIGILSSIVHITAVLSLPAFTPKGPVINSYESLPLNQITRFTPKPDQEPPFAFEDPDMEIIICRYDARKAPVRFTGPLPRNYWSLTIHDSKGRNLFATNETHDVFEKMDIIIDTGNREIDAPDKTLIIQKVAPVGMVILRIFRPSSAYEERVKKLAGEIQCGPLRI